MTTTAHDATTCAQAGWGCQPCTDFWEAKREAEWAAVNEAARVRLVAAGHDFDADMYGCGCSICQEAYDAEAKAEMYAEGAWLRAAEAGNPETWREEDLARQLNLGYRVW